MSNWRNRVLSSIHRVVLCLLDGYHLHIIGRNSLSYLLIGGPFLIDGTHLGRLLSSLGILAHCGSSNNAISDNHARLMRSLRIIDHFLAITYSSCDVNVLQHAIIHESRSLFLCQGLPCGV